jgi:hypothetical protein
MGPMTGRAAGHCAGYDVPGYVSPMPGRGFDMGRGWRWRHWCYASGLPGWARLGRIPDCGYGPYGEPVTREQEVESLKARAGWLEERLDAIRRCLGELEKEE